MGTVCIPTDATILSRGRGSMIASHTATVPLSVRANGQLFCVILYNNGLWNTPRSRLVWRSMHTTEYIDGSIKPHVFFSEGFPSFGLRCEHSCCQ